MNWFYSTILVCALHLACLPRSVADTPLRCGNKLVDVGMTMDEVLKHCGEPADRARTGGQTGPWSNRCAAAPDLLSRRAQQVVEKVRPWNFPTGLHEKRCSLAREINDWEGR
jgi:Protein of unknown function (DUF2845)